MYVMQAALGSSMDEVCDALGGYMSSSDTHTIIQSLLANMSHSSPPIRRTVAHCAITVACSSPSPTHYLAVPSLPPSFLPSLLTYMYV